jgi:hypothetical protein
MAACIIHVTINKQILDNYDLEPDLDRTHVYTNIRYDLDPDLDRTHEYTNIRYDIEADLDHTHEYTKY